MRDPQFIIDVLQRKHFFELNETGPLVFHLSADFFRNSSGTSCVSPVKCIDRIVSNYKMIFDENPKMSQKAPLAADDHPELNTFEFLDATGTQQHQFIIGSSQWVIFIERFDISVAVATVFSFASTPRRGHLDRAKRMVECLAGMRRAAMRFATQEPDHSDVHEPFYS